MILPSHVDIDDDENKSQQDRKGSGVLIQKVDGKAEYYQ